MNSNITGPVVHSSKTRQEPKTFAEDMAGRIAFGTALRDGMKVVIILAVLAAAFIAGWGLAGGGF